MIGVVGAGAVHVVIVARRIGEFAGIEGERIPGGWCGSRIGLHVCINAGEMRGGGGMRERGISGESGESLRDMRSPRQD